MEVEWLSGLTSLAYVVSGIVKFSELLQSEIWDMCVWVVDKSLEVLHSDDFPTLSFVFDLRVESLLLVVLRTEHILDRTILKKVFLAYAKDLKGLLLCHESATNSQAFVSNLLP